MAVKAIFLRRPGQFVDASAELFLQGVADLVLITEPDDTSSTDYPTKRRVTS